VFDGTIRLRVTDDHGASAVDTAALKVDINAKTICSTLGGGKSPDTDTFKFKGLQGEQVAIRLEGNLSKPFIAGKATIMLMQGRQVIKKDLTALPIQMSANLPKSGDYQIAVVEQQWGKPLGFHGNYCLTMQSSLGSWQSLQTTLDVE